MWGLADNSAPVYNTAAVPQDYQHRFAASSEAVGMTRGHCGFRIWDPCGEKRRRIKDNTKWQQAEAFLAQVKSFGGKRQHEALDI